QVWYSVSLDDSTLPNRLCVFETRFGANLYHSGLLQTARAMVLFPNITTNVMKPLIGTEMIEVPGGNYTAIHQADTGTTDSGEPFRAYVITKPYLLGDLWTKFGLMAGMLLGKIESGATLLLRMIRN